MKLLSKIIQYIKSFWKRHICDVVPEELDDLF
jgi:hypothetical protein